MSWNYRIVQTDDGDFGLYEVHYGENGIPNNRTEKPISFVCGSDEGPDGILKSLALALADAYLRPILIDKDQVWSN